MIIQVEPDHVIIQQLNKWKESISFEDALLSSEVEDLHTFDADVNTKEIKRKVSAGYLNSVILPNCDVSCERYDVARNTQESGTNLVNLGFNGPFCEEITKSMQENFVIDGLQFSQCSGAFWYPPKGYMGWHSNADHAAFRMYATWVPEGHKSFFRYRDPDTGKVITSWDRKGWTFRLFECRKDNKTWHSVYSNTDRISIGFWYDRVRREEQ